MPTYSYRCTECASAFDIQQAFTDNTLTVCPVCDGVLRKVFSPIGVSFSGSGFYRNDSRAPSKPESKGEKGEKGDSKSDSKADSGGGAGSKSDSVSASKSDSTPAPTKSEKAAASTSSSPAAVSPGSGSKSTTP